MSAIYEALAVAWVVTAGVLAVRGSEATWAAGSGIAAATLALVAEHRKRG